MNPDLHLIYVYESLLALSLTNEGKHFFKVVNARIHYGKVLNISEHQYRHIAANEAHNYS